MVVRRKACSFLVLPNTIIIMDSSWYSWLDVVRRKNCSCFVLSDTITSVDRFW